jgi:carbamoyl-phosphate synthase large subunit
MTHRPTIAVTALNATDNPGPGVSVIRALRHHPDFDARIVGLAYDSLEPGLYAHDLVDDAYLIPYPSQGREALASRLEYIDDEVGLDVVIPTLDSELTSFVALEERLAKRGIGMFVPTQEQIALRSKANLVALGEAAGFPVPASRVISDVSDLYGLHEELAYPFWVKGQFYGAKRALAIDDAIQAFHEIVAKWGLPVLVQASVTGDEIDVAGVGDGRGGLVGAVAMKKTFLTEKGKGWAGVAIKDAEALELTRRFVEATKWRGPFELEAVKEVGAPRYHVLEINPRFPAWIYLSAGAGANLPWAVAQLALGQEVAPMTDYTAGTMFVRISIDQLATMEDFQTISTSGEIHHSEKDNE